MKLSTRGRYATRALLDLASHQNEGPIQLKDIARRQQFSLQYLEHIITPLIASGMIRSVRGAGGGVWLARSPLEIRLSEVIGIVEGSTAPADCVNNPEACARSEFCAAREIWTELKEAMDRVLLSKTLQDLVDMQNKKELSRNE
jgi:Rrf2 family cysteine metabolism transcriptional repressor